MQRINVNTAPIVFLDKLTKLSHLYPNRFSQLNELNQPAEAIDVNI